MMMTTQRSRKRIPVRRNWFSLLFWTMSDKEFEYMSKREHENDGIFRGSKETVLNPEFRFFANTRRTRKILRRFGWLGA
jgi:hypothetical protein